VEDAYASPHTVFNCNDSDDTHLDFHESRRVWTCSLDQRVLSKNHNQSLLMGNGSVMSFCMTVCDLWPYSLTGQQLVRFFPRNDFCPNIS